MLNSSLEFPSLTVSPESQKSIGITPKHFKRCEKCSKLSCICREFRISPKVKLRSRLSPNNFRRYLPDLEKSKKPAGIGCVITPNISNKIYMPYIYSKKKINTDSNNSQLNISSSSLGRFKSQADSLLFNSSFKKKFDRDKFMKEKIVKIAIRYLNEPEFRYQRKKLIELLYNLIHKGERRDYACSAKKKIEEIADFLVKHNSDLNFESFMLNENEKSDKVVVRFDEFLKVFSNSIIR